MAANKPPHSSAPYGNGNGQPSTPSSSLGTAAVNRNSYYGDYQPLASHNAHYRTNGTLDLPSASSSSPQHPSQDFYAPPSSSSPSYNNQNHSHNHNHNHFQHPPPDNDYEQTLSNTLANSHLRSPPHGLPHEDHTRLFAPAPTRPTGKFKEEWDASQRGSSIINGPIPRHYNTNSNNMSSIQRSNSFSGSTSGGGGMDGSSSIQVSRSNTLKKKASLRRSGSLKRSSSRRSMKAGSVRSLALQSNTDEDEMHNAFYCPVPTTGNPTEALANRFQGT